MKKNVKRVLVGSAAAITLAAGAASTAYAGGSNGSGDGSYGSGNHGGGSGDNGGNHGGGSGDNGGNHGGGSGDNGGNHGGGSGDDHNGDDHGGGHPSPSPSPTPTDTPTTLPASPGDWDATQPTCAVRVWTFKAVDNETSTGSPASFTLPNTVGANDGVTWTANDGYSFDGQPTVTDQVTVTSVIDLSSCDKTPPPAQPTQVPNKKPVSHVTSSGTTPYTR